MVHTFLDNFYQGGKYSAQIASHQAQLRRENIFADQKYVSISSLQTDYLNLVSTSGFERNIERSNTIQTKCTFCGVTNHSTEKYFKRIRQEKEKSRVASHSDNRLTERTPRKCFRCRYQDHLIGFFSDQPKDNEKQKNQVRFN